MSEIFINSYSAICNLGSSLDTIFANAIKCGNEFFTNNSDIVKDKTFPLGKVKTALPAIDDEIYNLRCNRLLLYCANQLVSDIKKAINKYGKNRIGIVIGSTNAGSDEYEKSGNIKHAMIGNPAGFLKKQLGLSGYYCGVSTACTSGIKAFAAGKKLIDSGVCDAVIAGSTDAICKTPVFGFHALEVLSQKPTLPFSKNRNGINIGEGSALFILEKQPQEYSVKICAIGETSDAYHCATPDPQGTEAARAINLALKEANLKYTDIDYINMHGTGTISNDLMEANAIKTSSLDKTPASSTKSLTGHCLGASGGIETALCCAMLDTRINPGNFLLPHFYDNLYDDKLPLLNLVQKGQQAGRLNFILNNSFGFGGSNASMILGRACV